MSDDKNIVEIGLLGCGTIGSGVFHLLEKNSPYIERVAGKKLRVRRILVKEVDEPRPFEADRSIMTTDWREVISDDQIEIFVELIGGIEPAKSFALEILGKGKHLVTANKEILARYGPELMKVAAESGSQLLFEAAVGGGIPLIRPLEESLGGDKIRKIVGIVNGTTNYILSRMSMEGSTFDEALESAKRLGYAEANPEADIQGDDAASKIAILSSIAFRVGVTSDQVPREGISRIRLDDIENAKELGYAIKLLAIASFDDGEIQARVHPTMIPLEHPLSSISGNFNAIFVVGESVGELMFYGQGAGSLPTSTAIIGDLINIARDMDRSKTIDRSYWNNPAKIKSINEVKTRFYMVLRVVDRPGVLAKIAGVFGENMVSLESVVQKGIGEEAQIVLITHEVKERNFWAAKQGLARLEVVLDIPSIIRVESL